jgi:hypothetical protein
VPKEEAQVVPQKAVKTNGDLPRASSLKHSSYATFSVVVMIPIGLPGMGKTYLASEHLQPTLLKQFPESRFEIVSNDEIRQSCVTEYMQTNKNSSLKEATQKTHALVGQQFTQTFKDSVARAKKSGGKMIVFLDKNFTPGELTSMLA